MTRTSAAVTTSAGGMSCNVPRKPNHLIRAQSFIQCRHQAINNHQENIHPEAFSGIKDGFATSSVVIRPISLSISLNLVLLLQEPRFYKFQLYTAHKNFPLPPIAGPKNCGPGCCIDWELEHQAVRYNFSLFSIFFLFFTQLNWARGPGPLGYYAGGRICE